MTPCGHSRTGLSRAPHHPLTLTLTLTLTLSRIRHATALEGRRVDLCFAGVGDNAHLAFNEPPAEFDTTMPYLQVRLRGASHRQQAAQGCFANADQVPACAISMSVRQILRSERLLPTVTGALKAPAVRAMVEGPVDPQCPASSVQAHGACPVYLDRAAASSLSSPLQDAPALSPGAP